MQKRLNSLEGLKIVIPSEMVRIEKQALQEGGSEFKFIQNVGVAIAQKVTEFLLSHHFPNIVTILAGKGNNAADAYAAGIKLLQQGMKVTAWQFYSLEECSLACKQMHEQFVDQGGTVHFVLEARPFHFTPEGVILDGLVGTGFRGKAEGILAIAIIEANQSNHPILSIDTPSGLNSATGEVESVAIHATETLFVELPKLGFFLKEGMNCVGQLKRLLFGLEKKYIDMAHPEAFLFEEEIASLLLPSIKRTRHKYEAGYVLGFAGSPTMTGAGILSSYATLRAGAGIVRLFYSSDSEKQLENVPYEILHEMWDGKTIEKIKQEALRAKAIFIGPGMGKDRLARKKIKTLLRHLDLPTVLDADALFYLSEHPDASLPKETILTPHRQELKQLMKKTRFAAFLDKEELKACQEFVEEKNITLVLKGAPTFIFHPRDVPLCIPRGDPGLATAGSGDVLTGVIAALLAQGLPQKNAAILGVYIHALAAEAAAKKWTSYCMTASDLFDFIPQVFSSLLKQT